MKARPYEGDTDKRSIAYSRVDVIKLDTKCLFAGKLERIREWEEKPHSHPFCEILFVLSGEGTVEDAENSDTKPTYILKNIRELYDRIK